MNALFGSSVNIMSVVLLGRRSDTEGHGVVRGTGMNLLHIAAAILLGLFVLIFSTGIS